MLLSAPEQTYLPDPASSGGFRAGRTALAYSLTGIVCGLVLGYVLFDQPVAIAPAPDGTAKKPAAEQAIKTKTLIGSSAILVETQLPGDMAKIQKVTMPEDGWLTIRDNLDGQPGKILGALYLAGGSHQNITIELLRGMEDEGHYLVIIHSDDGDHVFNHETDRPLTDAAGRISTAPFDVAAMSPRGE